MAATARVFGTFELLENVLSRVPTKDLILCQRVAKAWRDTIDNSLVLQRALFFQPVSGELIQFTTKPLFYDKPRYGPSEVEELKRQVGGKCTVNPALGKLFTIMSYIDGDVSPGAIENTLADCITNHLPKGYSNSEASWRRMMPTQPPVDSPFFVDSLDSDVSPGFVIKRTFSYGKLFMGDIIDELDYSLRRYEKVASISSIIRRAAPVLYGNGFQSNCRERERRQQERRMGRWRPDEKIVVDGVELTGDEFEQSSDDEVSRVRKVSER